MMASQPVEPIPHSIREVSDDISAGTYETLRVRETIAHLAHEGSWKKLWDVADMMSKEVSVLFDLTGRIWVDIGTAGQVRLSPPMGAKVPFRLWVHTHPWDAYWSSTDLGTLASSSRILDEAIVLGHDHFKRTSKGRSDNETLSPSGPLSLWSSESCLPYSQLETGGDAVG